MVIALRSDNPTPCGRSIKDSLYVPPSLSSSPASSPSEYDFLVGKDVSTASYVRFTCLRYENCFLGIGVAPVLFSSRSMTLFQCKDVEQNSQFLFDALGCRWL